MKAANVDAAHEHAQRNGQEHRDFRVGPQGMEQKLEHGANSLSVMVNDLWVLALEP
ncbi:hypothetical protein D3C85_1924160 [compost metagenome]